METNSSPSVRRAVAAIREQISSGSYKAGNCIPSETGLAQELDVSRGTVRRAIDVLVLSGELSRKPHFRPRVQGNATPDSVKGKEVHVWISHPIADDATLQFLRGISYGLMGTNLRLVVREPSRFFGNQVKTEETQFLTEVLHNPSVAGVIIERDAFAENDDLYRMLVKRGKHPVFVDTPPPPGVAADYVGTANGSAARRCTDHLLQLGHSRIVFVAEARAPAIVQDRVRGYWRAMKQAGLEENGLVITADLLPPTVGERIPLAGVYSRLLATNSEYYERSQRLVREIEKMEPGPTAIIASCDVLAYWVCAVLAGSGVRVPNDIAVAGFDWLARWGDPSLDLLTTCSQDFEGFGYYAAEFVLDGANEPSASVARQVMLPAPLMVRPSTIGEAPVVAATNGGESRGSSQRYR